MITGICNIYLDTQTKLELFQENFSRVYSISDNWLVNIRGRYKIQAENFVVANFLDHESNCIFYPGIEVKNWAKATSKMLQDARHEYIYIFLEDHFLLKPVSHFQKVIQDMKKCKIDYFQYSFFNIGFSARNSEALYPDYSECFYYVEVNEKNLEFLKKNNRHFFPFSLAGICTRDYFEKLLNIEKKHLMKVPTLVQIFMENIVFFYPRNRQFWFLINKFLKLLGVRFVLYPPETPFNLEKSLFDCNLSLLPLTVGALRDELFANWDDDNHLRDSSLIKRGLYPSNLRILAEDMGTPSGGRDYALKAGNSTQHQYAPDITRLEHIPTKYILVKKGKLNVSSERETYVLHEGQSICLNSNIPHILFADEDTLYYVHISNSDGPLNM